MPRNLYQCALTSCSVGQWKLHIIPARMVGKNNWEHTGRSIPHKRVRAVAYLFGVWECVAPHPATKRVRVPYVSVCVPRLILDRPNECTCCLYACETRHHGRGLRVHTHAQHTQTTC